MLETHMRVIRRWALLGLTAASLLLQTTWTPGFSADGIHEKHHSLPASEEIQLSDGCEESEEKSATGFAPDVLSAQSWSVHKCAWSLIQATIFAEQQPAITDCLYLRNRVLII